MCSTKGVDKYVGFSVQLGHFLDTTGTKGIDTYVGFTVQLGRF